MLDRLPIFIEPLNYADRRRELSGDLDLSSFPRLADLPGFNNRGSVAVTLSFSKLGRIPALDGELNTIVELCCQNCLQPIKIPVSSKFKLGFVSSLSEADLLPDGYEPFLLESDKVALVDIAEDELLLTIPAFPKHTEGCLDTRYQKIMVQVDTQSDTENPFSVLAKLKNTGE